MTLTFLKCADQGLEEPLKSPTECLLWSSEVLLCIAFTVIRVGREQIVRETDLQVINGAGNGDLLGVCPSQGPLWGRDV